MTRETISMRQAISIIIIFITGSSAIMDAGGQTGQDSWISLLIAAVWAVPVVLIYGRIMRLYPEKDIFEIIETLFGKVGGKLFIVLLCWYAIHLCALVMRDFSEFTQIDLMPETPQLPIIALILLVSAYLAKSGIESLGKWSIVVLLILVFVIILTIIFSLNKMDFSNIQPIFEHDIGTIASGSFSLLTFPFAETVLFLGVAGSIKKTDNPNKIYIIGILMGAAVLLLVMLRNLELLGPAMVKAVYFPSYFAARIINIGDFLSRIEGSISMNFILGGITKTTLCLLVASKGASALFGIKDYKRMVMPIGLLALALCAILYKSTMEMFDFVNIYQYYALPFQIVIPVIVWIVAEIKTRKTKKSSAKIPRKAAART